MKEVFAVIWKILAKIPLVMILFSVALISLFLLVAPEPLLEFLGVLSLRHTKKAIIGLAFLSSLTILIVQLCAWGLNSFRSWLSFSGRDAKRRLDAIGEWNRALVRQLYETPSHSQRLPLQSANVQAMLSEHIIINANLGDGLEFDCVLQPWVVEFLDKHKRYLESIKKFDEPFEVRPRLFNRGPFV